MSNIERLKYLTQGVIIVSAMILIVISYMLAQLYHVV